MHRFDQQSRQSRNSLATLLLAGATLFLVPASEAFAAAAGGSELQSSSAVSGIVRDARGVAQMGALVQVVAQGTRTVGTAFTDLHGHYTIANLRPGRYIVRASATLYVPATRADLELRRGATTVVNLTLAALFDPTSWLPAERRRPDEPADDWKWTLRSSANRPILRILNDGTTSVSAESPRPPAALVARETVIAGDGGFGQGGVHNIVELHRVAEAANTMVRADLGASAGAPSQVDAGFEQKGSFGSALRTVVSYQIHPGLLSINAAGGAQPAGLQVLEVTSAERMHLGERIEIEAGGQLQSVHTTSDVLATHPFLRVTGHPGGSWTLEYRLATDRTVQGYEDVTSAADEVPTATVRDGQLALAMGHHQELSAAHKSARATMAVALYRDSMTNTAISGLGGAPLSSLTPEAATAVPIAVPASLMIDPQTGEFRTLAGGYTTTGARFTVSAPLTQGVWIAAEYSTGDAFTCNTVASTTYAQALRSLSPHESQAAMLALETRVIGSATEARASYRWQPANVVTAVDPYSELAAKAYLSVLIQQPLRFNHHMPQGFSATIDVTNLLAQGYRPFLSPDGQTLYFAQAPRTVQAGLSFNF